MGVAGLIVALGRVAHATESNPPAACCLPTFTPTAGRDCAHPARVPEEECVSALFEDRPAGAPWMLTVEPDHGWAVVRPAGELDLATVPDLAAAVQALRDGGCAAVRIDLSGLSFLDSSGLRYVLELARAPGLRLAVTPGPPAVQRVFEVTGVVHLVPFIDPSSVP
jgi:anti-sigma B factor antagonist